MLFGYITQDVTTYGGINMREHWLKSWRVARRYEAVARCTECSPESVALQTPGSIAQECAGAPVAKAGVLSREPVSLCDWCQWVRTSIRSDWVSNTVCGRESAPRVAVSRPGDWRYWERRCQELRTTWSATKWCCVRPVNSELRPVRAGVMCVCVYGRRQGLELILEVWRQWRCQWTWNSRRYS